MAQKNVQLPDTVNIFGLNIPTGFTNYFKVDTNTGTIIPTYQGGQPIPGAKVTDLNSINRIRAAAGLGPIDANGKVTGPAPTTSAPTTGQTSTTNPASTPIEDPLKSQTLSYPSNLSSSNKEQTYIRFKSYDYTLAQSSQQIFNVGTGFFGDVLTGLANLTTGEAAPKTYSSDVIDLYVPPNINVGYGANWGEAALGAIGSKYENTIASALGTATNTLTTEGIGKILGNVPGVNINAEQAIGLTTGLILNKNEFSTFTNMNMRTFTYSFLLVARNNKEKENIYRIINAFKIGMHPRSSTLGVVNTENPNSQTATSRFPVLKYPKLWTIEYSVNGKSNRFLPKTKYCGITSLNINYTPNSVFTTLSEKYDWAIPAVQMDIAFKELTPLIGDEIIDSKLSGIGDYVGGVDTNYNYTFDINRKGGTF